MAEQNVNLIVRQEEKNEEEVVVSLSAIVRKLKKYFTVWLLVAILIGGLITGASVFFSTTSSTPVRAIVSFTYSGIEKGENPDGTDFDPNTLKNPEVIKKALAACNMEPGLLEAVRGGIDIEGAIPQDTWHRLNTYENIYEKGSSGQMQAATQMLDTSWHSTQYNITFKYGSTSLSRSDAVQVLNGMLTAYRDYFFEQYGYNEALGSALEEKEYSDYDYGQTIDLYRTTLNSLADYVSGLSRNDTTRFRSTVTGYTFADLSASISTLQSLDLSMISAFQRSNNLTKDKDQLAAYYQDRINLLERQQAANKDTLAAIESAFDKYEKGQVIVFGGEDINTQTTVNSAEYDKLVDMRIESAKTIAKNKEDIAYYKECLAGVKSGATVGGEKAKRIEKDLTKLHEKVINLIDNINATANDYYQNVSLANAYNILVPATSSAATTVTSGISKAIVPLFGIEVILLMLYLGISFFSSLVEMTRKRKLEIQAAKAGKAAADSTEAEAETDDTADAGKEESDKESKKK